VVGTTIVVGVAVDVGGGPADVGGACSVVSSVDSQISENVEAGAHELPASLETD